MFLLFRYFFFFWVVQKLFNNKIHIKTHARSLIIRMDFGNFFIHCLPYSNSRINYFIVLRPLWLTLYVWSMSHFSQELLSLIIKNTMVCVATFLLWHKPRAIQVRSLKSSKNYLKVFPPNSSNSSFSLVERNSKVNQHQVFRLRCISNELNCLIFFSANHIFSAY